MKNVKTFIYLLFIFIFGFIIRYVGQPSYPACLHRDEVQWAYNSYSVAQTGKDEWGAFLPLHFKYNGEYHVPLVMYIPAIVFKIFGPSDVGFRIPFIIIGSLIPVLGYFFAKTVSKRKLLPILFSFLLAINPWQIMNSRASGELSVLSLFFGIAGFVVLFNFIQNKKKLHLLISALLFLMTYFSYIASRFDIPLLLLLFITIFFQKIPHRKFTLPILTILIILPYILVALYPQRFSGTNIISKHVSMISKNPETYASLASKIKTYTQTGKDILFEFTDNYFDYLNPYYIFRNMGEYDRTNLAESGSLYTFEFVFVLLGIISFLAIKNTNVKSFVLIWLLITPLVGSLTYNFPDRPNSSRTVYFYFMISLLSAYGLMTIITYLRDKKLKPLIYLSITTIALLNIGYVWSNFYKYGNQTMSKARGCGYKELFTYTENNKSRFDNIYIGTLYDYPYVQYLWYTKYDPANYHQFLQITPKEKSVVLIHEQNPHDWKLDMYTYAHNSCLMQTDNNSMYVGNFNDCKEKYWVRVKKDNKNGRIVFVLPDLRANGKRYIVYKDENTIRRLDNYVVYNLYSYQSDYENIVYSDKEIEAMEYVD